MRRTTENGSERERAAGALMSLSVNPDNQVAVAQAGAIEPLVRLLAADTPGEREKAAAPQGRA